MFPIKPLSKTKLSLIAALSLTLIVPASTVFAALTFNATNITSDGALNLSAAAASIFTLPSSSTTALNIQSGLMDFDTTNSRVGIGTIAPSSKITIDNTSPAPFGPELITNGTFTGGTTGWTLGSNVAYGTNNVVSTYAGGAPSLSTTFATTAGHTYQLTFTVSSANAPLFSYTVNNTIGIDDSPFSNGNGTIIFQTNYTGTETITFNDNNYATGDTWTLDNVSIKETTLPSPSLKVIGYDGLPWLSLGGDILANTAIGDNALVSNTTGNANTAIGVKALQNNTTGLYDIAMGRTALYSNTTGYHNSAMGTAALYSNTTGHDPLPREIMPSGATPQAITTLPWEH